jgi:hypothetical protein
MATVIRRATILRLIAINSSRVFHVSKLLKQKLVAINIGILGVLVLRIPSKLSLFALQFVRRCYLQEQDPC